MKRTAIAVSLLATTALVAPAAQASTRIGASPVSAVSSTGKAIADAAAHNRLTGAVPTSDIEVSSIRVTHSGLWASAVDTPKDHRTDAAQVVLHKVDGRWVAQDLGTDGVGCLLLKQRTRAALGLWGAC